MPDVFTYTGYRPYLRAWLAERRGRTLRGTARKLGCSAPLLSAVLNEDVDKQRRMNTALVDAFCDLAGLDDEEAQYFRLLVQFDQAPTPPERERAWEKLSALHRFRAGHQLQHDAYHFFSEWHHAAIFELASCPGFRPDPRWIARQLRPRISSMEAQKALTLLVDLRLLQWQKDGTLRPIEQLIRDHEKIDPRVRSLAMYRFHRWHAQRGEVALEEVAADERLYNAVTVAVPLAALPRVRQKVRECLSEILSLCEEMGQPPAQVIQVNVQVYPLSEVVEPGAGTPEESR